MYDMAHKLQTNIVPEKHKKLRNDGAHLEEIIESIKTGKFKNIITMAGAGISTAAGIPDFRSPGSGVYHNLKTLKLASPEDIFHIDFFKKNPLPLLTLAKRFYPGIYKPTLCHYFVKLLSMKGVLLRHYTQNIDTLERLAGLPDENLVEAHGSFSYSHCLGCRKEYSMEWTKDCILKDNVPTCIECRGLVKPDIVLFGEFLPTDFYCKSLSDFPKADFLIIMGTSLSVEPFCSLVGKVKKSCPRLMINKEMIRSISQPEKLSMDMFGVKFKREFDPFKHTRDQELIGDCDEGCLTLANKLGWEEELKAIIEEGHRNIDKNTNIKVT